MSKAEQIASEDFSKWTNEQLIATRNLADFESKCAVVIGERVFSMLLPKVIAELNKRSES